MAKDNLVSLETIKESAELLPPEGHKDVGTRVFEILGEIVADKESRSLPKKWSRNYELSRNKHWRAKSTKKVALVSANLLHTHRSRTVNLLTDNNPTFNIRKIGRNKENEPIFESLLKTAEFWWRDQEQQHVLEKSVTNGETYGVTVEKVHFDPNLEFGIGEVKTDLIDPFYFGVYPVNKTDNQEADANLHYYPMTVRQARRMWPDKAREIKGDLELINDLGDDRHEIAGDRKAAGYLSTFGSAIKNMISPSDKGKGEGEEEVLIVECWVKDYTMITEEEPVMEPVIEETTGEPAVDLITGEPIMEQTGTRVVTYPKYPGHIRCVTCCNGGQTILGDRGNPSINPLLPPELARQTYLFDKFPFSMTQSITDTTDPWGQCDMEQLEMMQMEIDKTLSQFTLLKDKGARLKLINPKTSGVDNKEFDNIPGIIRPANEAVSAAIKYMDPPVMQREVIEGLNLYKEFFFLIAGTFDLDAAQQPGKDVVAYKAIAALIERASTMLKGKIRNYSKMIRMRGRMYLSHVQNWYTEERMITFEEGGEEQSLPIRGTEMIAPAKLVVVSGSTMPISKVQEREEALALFQMGAIDLEELLHKLEWPDRKAVIKRLEMGPIGQFIERLIKMGLPEEFGELFMQISQMEDKDFERALEKGEIPPMQQLIRSYLEAGGQLEEQASEAEQVEVQKGLAEIAKLNAETRLIEAKIETEEVDRDVSRAGMGFDREKMDLEKAKTVADIKSAMDQLELDIAAMKVDLEKTKMSTEAAAKKAAQTGEKKTSTPAPKKSSTSRKRGPYAEKGLKSNNKKK